MGKINETLRLFKGVLSNTFKLQPSAEQQKEKERKKILKGFNETYSCLAADFIATAQTILTGEQYVCESVGGTVKTILAGYVCIADVVVVPTNAVDLLRGLVDQYDLILRDKVYKDMGSIKHIVLDTTETFPLYDYKTGLVNDKLVTFNPEFKWIVKRVVELCLENPTMSMYEAMEKILLDLKEMMLQRAKTSQLQTKDK